MAQDVFFSSLTGDCKQVNRPNHYYLSRLYKGASYFDKKGWNLTPVLVDKKIAYLKKWNKRNLEFRDLAAELKCTDKGIGVVTGKQPSGQFIVDIDLDSPCAVDLAPYFLPPTGFIYGRGGKRTSHYFYNCETNTRQYSCREHGMLIELRGEKLMSILPPSKHVKSKSTYELESYGEPALITDPYILQKAVGQLAVASYLHHQGWPFLSAVFFAENPEIEIIKYWQQTDPDCPNLLKWLDFDNYGPLFEWQRQKNRNVIVSPFTQALLNRVNVLSASDLCGYDLRPGRQPCPFHSSRSGKSLQVSDDLALWRCWADCGSGNAIDFVAYAKYMTYKQARNWLGSILGVSWKQRRGAAPAAGQQTKPNNKKNQPIKIDRTTNKKKRNRPIAKEVNNVD